MKKQANIFAIVSIACAALGLILKYGLALFNQFTKVNYFWKMLDSSDIIVTIVVLVFCMIVPALIVAVVQILFSIFAFKASLGKKSFVNWIAIIVQMFAAPILSLVFSAGIPMLILNILTLDTDIYTIYNSACATPLANAFITIAGYTVVAANAFAIAEKKLGLPEKFETEE